VLPFSTENEEIPARKTLKKRKRSYWRKAKCLKKGRRGRNLDYADSWAMWQCNSLQAEREKASARKRKKLTSGLS